MCKITSLYVQRLTIFALYLTQNWIFAFRPVTSKNRCEAVSYCTCQLHVRCKFGDRRSI